VRGGVTLSGQVAYSSVDPGRSACHACDQHALEVSSDPRALATARALAELRARSENPTIGLFAALAGSLVAAEVLRYVTDFAPPAAAGQHWTLDQRTGAVSTRPWPRWPDCPTCALAPAR
jgi:molybdopterin-synthase adenylyltransferase